MYKMIPEVVNTTTLDDNDFFNLQVKYKNLVENYLASKFNFKDFDLQLNSEIEIPVLESAALNFYHFFSKLGSKYIFMRNNIHIERLSNEELFALRENANESFILNTISKVLTEEGDFTFYGEPYRETMAMSKALNFEFAYNDLVCEIPVGKKIMDTFNAKKDELLSLSNLVNMPVGFVINKGFDNSLRNEEDEEESSIFKIF